MTAKLSAGAKAPNFRLPRDGGGEIALADFKGRKLVLYFYPKADTSGCTIEAKDFSRLAPPLPAPIPQSLAFRPIRWQAGQVQSQA